MIKGISVVIPNFNGITLFNDTLPTVFEALENTNLPYEVIVVDDVSTDDSVTYLQKNYPAIRVIKNEQNAGFSITANRGIEAATHDKVLLLNSDVQLTPNYFINQFHYFDDPKTFGVMGRIIGWHDEIIQDGAKYPSSHGVKIKTTGNYLLQDESKMKAGLYTMYLSGANAFFDKTIFLTIGGINPIFSPFYSEDFELSLRAWRLGFVCIYDHSSICKHKESHTIKRSSKRRYVNTIYDRNKMFVHAIHLEGIKKLLWYVQLIPETLIRLFTGRWFYLRSLYQFLTSLQKVNTSIAVFNSISVQLKTKKSVSEVSEFIKKNISGKIIKF